MNEIKELYNKIDNLICLLDRKLELLNKILTITSTQNIIFQNSKNKDINDIIDISLDGKQKLIDELIAIDNMFLNIFESFNGSLNNNKKIFKDEIKSIQIKIHQITDIDFKIRIQEEKNRQIYNGIPIKNNSIYQKSKILKISKQDMIKKYNDNKKI